MELIEGVVTRDGKATVRAGGESVQLTAPGADLKAARDAVLASAKDAVRERGEVCRLEITDNGRRHVFAAHPDGSLVPLADPSPADAAELHNVVPSASAPVAPAPAAPEPALIEEVPTGASLLTAAPVVPVSTPQLAVPPRPDLSSVPVEAPGADRPVEPAAVSVPPADQGPVTRRSLRDTTFLVDDSRPDPAAKGFRGLLTRVGIKQEPSAAELAERDDIAVVSRHWPGTRTVAVVNRKGGSAKALAVGEPVLTPTGYRPIGSLEIGDRVYGTDGHAHLVLGVYPQGERDLYAVRFTDGTVIHADEEHLWEVRHYNDRSTGTACVGPECGRDAVVRGMCRTHAGWVGRNPNEPLRVLRSGRYVAKTRNERGNQVLTTRQLLDAGLFTDRGGERGRRHHFFVPVTSPVQFPKTELPLDPYFVGLLLGDGNISGVTLAFTSADEELHTAVAGLVPAGVRVRVKDQLNVRFPRTDATRPNPLAEKLKALGLYGARSEHKFIPATYKLGSADARLAVLQGLLDTDGTVGGGGVAAAFTSVSEQLVNDVKFVAETLGCVASKSMQKQTSYMYRGERRSGQPAWNLYIKPPINLPLFRLERKQSLMKKGQRSPYRAIASIEPAGRGEAVCIEVSAANHLFLTRSCIPTHNTPVVAGLSAVFGRYGGGGVLAWDNNENSGTLPIRTEQEPHEASVLDLLRDEDRLRDGQSHGLIAGYVHHQSADRYDVLWSDQNDFGDHEIEAEEVRRAHAVASRYYRMLVMDSGNTARAANWKAMIELTNQLVIATTTGEDRAELGSRTLQTIAERDEHGARLAENAVVVVSCWKPADMVEAQRIAGLFEPLVRSVVIVPFDNALKAGRIRFDAMHPTTQRAWLAAAAAVGRGL